MHYASETSGSIAVASKLYPAIVQQTADGYRLFFPDLPDCAATGSSVQEAELAAEEMLATYLSEKPAPAAPTWMGGIGHDPSTDEVGVILVRAVSHGVPARTNFAA